MAMVKLSPAFKDYLWGGTKLKERYNKVSDMDIMAESWVKRLWAAKVRLLIISRF